MARQILPQASISVPQIHTTWWPLFWWYSCVLSELEKLCHDMALHLPLAERIQAHFPNHSVFNQAALWTDWMALVTFFCSGTLKCVQLPHTTTLRSALSYFATKFLITQVATSSVFFGSWIMMLLLTVVNSHVFSILDLVESLMMSLIGKMSPSMPLSLFKL